MIVNFPLLSGKILRTGFPVQQFHICASRGFLTLMAAKAINGHEYFCACYAPMDFNGEAQQAVGIVVNGVLRTLDFQR